jgi:hypothetical protein
MLTEFWYRILCARSQGIGSDAQHLRSLYQSAVSLFAELEYLGSMIQSALHQWEAVEVCGRGSHSQSNYGNGSHIHQFQKRRPPLLADAYLSSRPQRPPRPRIHAHTLAHPQGVITSLSMHVEATLAECRQLVQWYRHFEHAYRELLVEVSRRHQAMRALQETVDRFQEALDAMWAGVLSRMLSGVGLDCLAHVCLVTPCRVGALASFIAKCVNTIGKIESLPYDFLVRQGRASNDKVGSMLDLSLPGVTRRLTVLLQEMRGVVVPSCVTRFGSCCSRNAHMHVGVFPRKPLRAADEAQRREHFVINHAVFLPNQMCPAILVCSSGSNQRRNGSARVNFSSRCLLWLRFHLAHSRNNSVPTFPLGADRSRLISIGRSLRPEWSFIHKDCSLRCHTSRRRWRQHQACI